jgi:hypothetical protein
MIMQQQPLSIDALPVHHSLIDLSDKNLPVDFGMEEYVLSRLMDDVMLLEFCDLQGSDDGVEYIMRGGIAIPINNVMNAWRKGRVILKGPNVRYTEVGEIVMFPANMGVQIGNLEVEGYGSVKKGLFLNEQRMFGIAAKK